MKCGLLSAVIDSRYGSITALRTCSGSGSPGLVSPVGRHRATAGTTPPESLHSAAQASTNGREPVKRPASVRSWLWGAAAGFLARRRPHRWPLVDPRTGSRLTDRGPPDVDRLAVRTARRPPGPPDVGRHAHLVDDLASGTDPIPLSEPPTKKTPGGGLFSIRLPCYYGDLVRRFQTYRVPFFHNSRPAAGFRRVISRNWSIGPVSALAQRTRSARGVCAVWSASGGWLQPRLSVRLFVAGGCWRSDIHGWKLPLMGFDRAACGCQRREPLPVDLARPAISGIIGRDSCVEERVSILLNIYNVSPSNPPPAQAHPPVHLERVGAPAR